MNKSIVRCRCGHQVLAKEVLRTDLYERRASEGAGREYVYVKFRCRRCKRMGEAFVAESRWDWSILEPEPGEMSDAERDHFLDEAPISAEEILDFHRRLEGVLSLSELDSSTTEVESNQPRLDSSLPPAPEPQVNEIETPSLAEAQQPASEALREAGRERDEDQKPSTDFTFGTSAGSNVVSAPDKSGAVNPASTVKPAAASDGSPPAPAPAPGNRASGAWSGSLNPSEPMPPEV